MTFDSVPELARRVLHLEMELKRNKPSASLHAGVLSKRISTLEGKVAQIQAVKPTVPQTYTPKPAAVLPKVADTSLATKVTALERKVDLLKVKESPIISNYGRPVFLSTPLTSTDWDGDAYSTTSKTLIDLSSVFGAPAGIKAVLLKVILRDSASSGADCAIYLSPNDISGTGMAASCERITNDVAVFRSLVVPCDSNGDIYYQTTASGSGTLDVWLEIHGYWE